MRRKDREITAFDNIVVVPLTCVLRLQVDTLSAKKLEVATQR